MTKTGKQHFQTQKEARKAKPKFIFTKPEYAVSITFPSGSTCSTFTTTMKRREIMDSGQNEQGLFIALVKKADQMELPSPRLYKIHGVKKIYPKETVSA